MSYKNIPVNETVYAMLSQMKGTMNARSFNDLMLALIAGNRKKSMLGAAKWMSQPERDETDRRF